MNILVFGAHPDDIEIGMGGSIAKFSKKGHHILGIIATIPPKKDERMNEAKNAAKILGMNIELLDINFEELYFDRKIVKIIDTIIKNYKPDIVFTHWDKDSHQDHNVLTNGVIASTRKNDCSVYMYEQTIPGGIVPDAFNSQMYIDISNEINLKLQSIKAHKSQYLKNGEWWEYGIKGRAMYRGYQINAKFAESFQVVKEIFKF